MNQHIQLLVVVVVELMFIIGMSREHLQTERERDFRPSKMISFLLVAKNKYENKLEWLYRV